MHSLYRYFQIHKTAAFIKDLILIIISAILQVLIMEIFMEPLNLISGGFTGLSLFIHRIANNHGVNLSTSMMIILLNTPCALFCLKKISKRFVVLSVTQYMLVSILLNVIHANPLFNDYMLNLLFGGIGWGFSIALALTASGSTGGTDFIAQYVSNKIHRSIFNYVFYGNCIMYIAYGICFGWLYAGYSIIFQFLSTQSIQAFYHRYSMITIEVYSKNPDEIIDAFLATVQHGMTVMKGYGAFKGQEIWVCHATISQFEVRDVVYNLRKVDPHCIINTWKTQTFVGNFRQKPID